jgi:hypothetical protein
MTEVAQTNSLFMIGEEMDGFEDLDLRGYDFVCVQRMVDLWEDRENAVFSNPRSSFIVFTMKISGFPPKLYSPKEDLFGYCGWKRSGPI